jgi:hypothetical protein
MLHISPERLAALVDETASPDEATHLAACAPCADELAAHRRLVRMAYAETPREGPPLNDWASLGAMLRAEGIVSAAPPVAARTSRSQWVVRIAAGLVLVVGGAVVGRNYRNFDIAFGGAAQQAAATTPAAAAPTFASSQAAMQVLTSAQQQYSDAAAYLAAQDTTSHFIGLNVNTYRARLTALDNIVASTRTALYQAPQDPVLNQYYLSAVAAREATLRQLQAALPAKQQLERY